MDPIWQILIPSFIAPISVAVMSMYIKSSLSKMEQISTVLMQVKMIEQQLAEIKVDLNKLNDIRESFILTKSEVKTQWVKVDELKRRLENLEQR